MAVPAAGTSRRRILDYLNDGEEFGIDGPSSSPAATPRALAAARSLLPRFRWARLARLGGKARPPAKAVAQKETVSLEPEPEEGELRVRDSSPASPSASAMNDLAIPAACAAVTGDVNGGETRRPSDLGVGLSLVFLLAKTSHEFNKMARVRAEMEALITDFKAGQQQAMATATNAGDDDHENDVPEDRNVESAASSCLTDANEPQVSVGRQRQQHHHQDASSSGKDMEAASRRRTEMEVLEEELHAELERVRAGYGPDTPPFPPDEERDGGGAEHLDDDYDDVAEDSRQGFESDYGDDEDDHDHHDDEEEDDDDDPSRYHGVSAVELERRLHELLHQRNQDRIEELEDALRRAEKRLFEKEMEASLWKDTAKMAFRHDHRHHDDDDSP